MPNKWPTEHADMQVAQDVLIRFFHDDDTGDFGIEEVTVVQEGSMIVERSDWVVALEEAFQDKYGDKKGLEVTNHVVTSLIVTGNAVH